MADVQEELLKAIDYLVNNRVDAANRDKTIVATVKEIVNLDEGEYKLSYSGGFFYGYATGGEYYKVGIDVYVLVPENDFSKKKLIVGSAENGSVTDNSITSIASLLSSYSVLGSNTISPHKTGRPLLTLCSFKPEEYIMVYSRTDTSQNLVDINQEVFKDYVQDAKAFVIEATFQTAMVRKHRLSTTGSYGLEFNLAFQDADDKSVTNIKTFVLDTENMSGNPFQYVKAVDQYRIFTNVDMSNFLYIESIMAFSKGFEESFDALKADRNGNSMYDKPDDDDIYISDLEIYGLKEMSATNGDYSLRASVPQGANFNSISSSESLSIQAQMIYKEMYITDESTFYWFLKDDRIDSSSDGYNAYAGSGWRELSDKGNGYTIATTGAENKAYKNEYMVLGVYKEAEIYLKQTVTLYNSAAKRELEITSSMGQQFSFDRGTPTLTCLIDGKESEFEDTSSSSYHKDDYFSFSWSVTANGKTTALNKTVTELNKELEEAQNNGFGYAAIQSIKSQINQMSGVEFSRNKLIYPVRNISSQATFSCSIYLKDSDDMESYYIGSASLTLKNQGAVEDVSDYYITFENGNQVFQYTETGVSPALEGTKDPQEVLPISCRFFDPAGLEVNPDTYSVSWIVPLEDSMIIIPEENMYENTATGKTELYSGSIFPLAIEEAYDYSAINNQLTCVITYDDKTFRQDTSLTFTKVGENGTNGTDMFCKITTTEPSNSLPAIEVNYANGEGYETPKWNTGVSLAGQELTFNLYGKGVLMDLGASVSWDISGSGSGSTSKTKYLSVSDGVLSWEYDEDASGYRNQIVRATAKYDSNTYYAFYPVPMIVYHNGADSKYKIRLSKSKTLRSILYNADGRNPLYNENQGLSFLLEDSNGETIESLTKKVVCTPIGGSLEDITTAGFTLKTSKSEKTGDTCITVETDLGMSAAEYEEQAKALESKRKATSEKDKTTGEETMTQKDIDLAVFYNSQLDKQLKALEEEYNASRAAKVEAQAEYNIYVQPNDVYDGAWSNNYIYCQVYETENSSVDVGTSTTSAYSTYLDEMSGYDSACQIAIEEAMSDYDEEIKKIEADTSLTSGDKQTQKEKAYNTEQEALTKAKEDRSAGYIKAKEKLEAAITALETKNCVLEAEIYLPIYMSLNTYGLASLNSWDGNHVEINEDGEYILAPQIGAGEKNSANQFTGILMGTQKTYDSDDSQIGLFGYSAGKQSIFLNAEDGSATFGLPEDQASASNKYLEGRVILQPGGTSKIGMWNIGSRALYNMTKPEITLKYETDSDGNYIEDEDTGEYKYTIVSTGDYKAVDPDKPYSNYKVINSQISVPPDAQGLILNSNPAYISVKGAPLTSDNCDIKWNSLSRIQQGDALEVEIDPQKSSVFSIYRHTKWKKNSETKKPEKTDTWRRYPVVGINSSGEFYSNAVENQNSSMGIGEVGAFGVRAADSSYVGATFAYNGDAILKFFIDSGGDASDPLYLSGATSETNEYQRPIQIHGKSIGLYSSSTSSILCPSNDRASDGTITATDDRLVLSDDDAIFGHKDTYLSMPSSTKETTTWQIGNNFKMSVASSKTSSVTLGGSLGLDISGTSTLKFGTGNNTSNSAISATATGTVTLTGAKSIVLDTAIDGKNIDSSDSVFRLSMNGSNSKHMWLGNSKSYLELNSNFSQSQLYSTNGWKMSGGTGCINITNDSADGIRLDSTTGQSGSAFLHLIPKGGGGKFTISAGPESLMETSTDYGSITNKDAGSVAGVNNLCYVQATPGFATPWMTITSTVSTVSGSSGQYVSLLAHADIKSESGWMYAGNFRFNDTHTFQSDGYNKYTLWNANDLLVILQDIYTKLRTVYDNASSDAYNNVYNNLSTWLDNHGYATQSWANGKFSKLGHTHNYASSSHTHTYERVTIPSVGNGQKITAVTGIDPTQYKFVISDVSTYTDSTGAPQ